MELFFEAVGAFAVGFVEDENVADFHQAGFHVLDIIAKTGDENDEDTIGEADDVHFVLADSDGFDEDLVLACGVEKERDFGCGTGEAAEESARGHGANENAVIACVTLHADAIAENGPSCVRAGGIDRYDADALVLFAVVRGEAIDEGALAGAGSAGDAG